ncbi:MAG: succinyldiaminopimelate transaminase [Acidimicrobiia bacterium]|nr:succinyldiaminopimelate transaminase [Acidimicrobiia bacterium]
MSAAGFVPPPYPHDRLDAYRRLADAVPGGVVDCSIGNPVDPIPEFVLAALAEAAPLATGYPATIGSPDLRAAAAAWIDRRLGVAVDPEQVLACVGTKEFVASLPRMLNLRTPGRDTVLYPAVSYPTYAMGAELAGLRAVPVPLDAAWHLDLSRVREDDAARALLLWTNEPGNPTGAVASPESVMATVAWARERSIVIAADECYAEFSGGDPTTALSAGVDGVLAVHSLSKRSNMAGFRSGFVAGDPTLVRYLGEVRKHAGLMTPAPIQAAAAAALADDVHVATQRARYEERRALMLAGLAPHGLVHDGGPAPFYLWLHSEDQVDDGWELAAQLAEAGTLVAPGSLYGAAGADHIRLALTQPTERLELVLERLTTNART